MTLPIARRATQDTFGSASAALVNATYPAGPINGNTCIAVVYANVGGGIISVDSGFGLIAEATTGTMSCSVWAKISTDGDTSVVASATGATSMQMHLYEYNGIRNIFVPATDDTETDASGSGSTSLAIGPISTVFADDLVFVACAQGNTNGGSTSWATATNLQVGVTNRLMCGEYLPAAELTNFSDTASWLTSRIRAGVMVAFQPEQTAASSSDTATGTDDESVAGAVSSSEFQIGTEAESVAIAGSDPDSATGTEAESVASAFADADAATGLDEEGVAGGVVDPETGGASDLEAVAVTLTEDDTATGTDDGTVSAFAEEADADTATATDAELVGFTVTDPETGAVTEVSALALTLTEADLAGVLEGSVIVVGVTDTEGGTATEDQDVDAQSAAGGWLVGSVHV